VTKYFTADAHLGHANIVTYCSRPFLKLDGQPDTELMDETLALNWERTVQPDDEVFILGDLSFQCWRAEKFLARVPGKKFLVWGNHDPKKAQERAKLLRRCHGAADIMETKLHDGTRIVMCHYPMLSWNGSFHGSWMLHGHNHGRFEPKAGQVRTAKRMDVGVDAWAFTPVSEHVIRTHMNAVVVAEDQE
jgi:calcineurin-like phosphoesterase family protein